MVNIGVVGHGEVAEAVAAVVAADERAQVSRHPTVQDVASHLTQTTPGVDAWIFTSIHNYHQAEAAGLLDRPAGYVSYTAGALQQVLISALRAGRDIARLSVDTMSEAAVERAYAGAGLHDVATVQVCPFSPGLTTADYVSFHQERRRAGADLVVTCEPLVAEQLHDPGSVVLMHPLREAVDSTIEALVVEVRERSAGGAQIAIGHADADAPGLLASLGASFDGWVTTHPTTVLVSTRSGLEKATRAFTTFPLVDDAELVPGRLRIGFGIAFSAAEATMLADRALKRARLLGERAAVVLGRHATHLLHVCGAESAPAGSGSAMEPDLDSLARRAGLSVRSLRGVAHYAASSNPMTVRGLAEHLGVQDRSARRILNQLHEAGMAVRSVEAATGASGRPAATYLVTVPAGVGVDGGDVA